MIILCSSYIPTLYLYYYEHSLNTDVPLPPWYCIYAVRHINCTTCYTLTHHDVWAYNIHVIISFKIVILRFGFKSIGININFLRSSTMMYNIVLSYTFLYEYIMYIVLTYSDVMVTMQLVVSHYLGLQRLFFNNVIQ